MCKKNVTDVTVLYRYIPIYIGGDIYIYIYLLVTK